MQNKSAFCKDRCFFFRFYSLHKSKLKQTKPDTRHEGNQLLSLPIATPIQQEEVEVEEDKYDVNDESSIRIKKLRSMAIKNGVLALRPEDQSLAVVHGRFSLSSFNIFFAFFLSLLKNNQT